MKRAVVMGAGRGIGGKLRLRDEQAALNMLTRKLAVELHRQSIIVIAGLDAGVSGRLLGPDAAEIPW